MNMPLEMRRKLGRLAKAQGARSLAAWARGVLEAKLAEAREAGVELVSQPGQMMLKLVCLLVVGVGFGCVWWSAVAGENEWRRPGMVRTSVIVRTVRRANGRREGDGWDMGV